MKQRQNATTGIALCSISTALFVTSIYILFGDVRVVIDATCSSKDGCNNTPTFAGYALTTLTPLSFVPLLIFMMVRYVALQLYLEN
jgi:hypothetical protein